MRRGLPKGRGVILAALAISVVGASAALAEGPNENTPVGDVQPLQICSSNQGTSGDPMASCMAVGLAHSDGSWLTVDPSDVPRDSNGQPAPATPVEMSLAGVKGDKGGAKSDKSGGKSDKGGGSKDGKGGGKGGGGGGGGSTPGTAVLPLTPARLHAAYSLPTTTAGSSGQTIAIVDAYDDPYAKSDLDFYSQYYGLPVLPNCSDSVTTSCFQKVNQTGSTSPLPAYDAGWAQEISLDLDAAHATCQDCKILLVEANSARFEDLAAAVSTAASMGATEISNSYGAAESAISAADFTAFSPSYARSGVAIVAATGDSGYGPAFPADVNSVVAATGTTLSINASTGAWANEKVWSLTGSGCSKLASAPSWQTAAPGWSKTNCGSKRGIGDVAAPGDPNSGLYVRFKGAWYIIGGTSLSAPVIAGVYGLAANTQTTASPGSVPYANRTSFHDIVSGSNGSCKTTICSAGTGYDGPSGLGSPIGVGGF